MKKQINEVKRMQVLAGILKEEVEEMEMPGGQFPRDPQDMARAVADKFGDQLKAMSGKQRQDIALSHAYEMILNSGHPKAKVIAGNLVWGYADEDWPMDYISSLNSMLNNSNDIVTEDDDEEDGGMGG